MLPPWAPAEILNNNGSLPFDAFNTVRARVDAVKSNMGTLKDQIYTLRSALWSLERECEAHEKYLQAHEPLLSSTRSVPPEIWAEIFQYAQVDFEEDDWYFATFHPEAACVQVSQVSRSWRKISCETPGLWNNIQFSETELLLKGSLHMLDLWLHRSRPLPLSITLILSKLEVDINHEELCKTTASALRLICSYSRTWSFFHLLLDPEILYAETVTAAFQIGDAPMLKEMILRSELDAGSIRARRQEIGLINLLSENGSGAPMLEKIRLSDFYIDSRTIGQLSWSTMKVISLYGDFEPLPELWLSLQHCVNLEELSIGLPAEQAFPADFESLHLSKLRSLEIRYDGFEILQYLTTPSLVRLLLEGTPESLDIDAKAFIARSTSLQDLEIRFEEGLVQTAEPTSATSVEALKITKLSIPSLVVILNRLTNINITGQRFMPCLNTLDVSLEVSQEDYYDWGLLDDTLRLKDAIVELCSHSRLKQVKLHMVIDSRLEEEERHKFLGFLAILRDMHLEGLQVTHAIYRL